MLIIVSDPNTLTQYPHLSPPKPRLVDMVPDGHLVYEVDPGYAQAGHGRVVLCDVCGTYLRTGQVHASASPEPHASLDMVTVYEPSLVDEHASGRLAHELGE